MSFPPARPGWITTAMANSIWWSQTTCSGREQSDLYCTLDGAHKSYCTPESYKGTSVRLWHNLGNGKFEDATQKAGLGDPTSKSLGIAILDYNNDGWPDILIANDTQPNKLYLNKRDGTFRRARCSGGHCLQRRRRGARRHGSGRRRLRSLAAIPASSSATSPIRCFRCITTKATACSWTKRRNRKSAAPRW